MFLILDIYIFANLYLYAELFVYMIFVLVLCTFLLVVTYYLTKNIKRNYSIEKNSAYECGFNTFYNFEDSEEIINVRFFLMCILFLVFDLEICFLAPWAVTYDFSSFIPMMVFLFILTLGFAYEWQKGALDWY